MTRGGQYAYVLAGLLICLALTTVQVRPPQPVAKTAPTGGDDLPFPTRDGPTWHAQSAGTRPPASIVPEGLAVLLVTVIWAACRALLAWRPGHDFARRVLPTLSRRRSVG